MAAESMVITREARGLGHAEACAGAQTEPGGYVAAVEVTVMGIGLELYPDSIPVTTEPTPGSP